MSSWNFLCFSLDLARIKNQKLSLSLLMVATGFDMQGRGVFIPHNVSYLHLGLIFFKCIILPPLLFFL
jgi:hypothetical protein